MSVIHRLRPDPGLQRAFYSVSEAAELFGMSDMTLYRAIKAGEFPAVRIRGRLIIPARAIEEMVSAAMTARAEVHVTEWVPQTGEDPAGVEAGLGVAPGGLL